VYTPGGRVGAALRDGATIQRGDRFLNERVRLGGVSWAEGTLTVWYGPWLNGGKGVKNRYLGLKFQIKGRVHFGWARISVTTLPNRLFFATLTGYAYETIPNKAIVAGQTKGPDEARSIEPSNELLREPSPPPASLGLLAVGARGLSVWRRKDFFEPNPE
jgi:hypothetical protein